MIGLAFRRAVNQALGAGVSFTPALTQGVAVTSTITHARYTSHGKIAHVEIQLGVTSAGTAGSAVNLTQVPGGIAPKNLPANTVNVVGSFLWQKTGGILYRQGAVAFVNATSLQFFVTGGTNVWGVNPADTLANTDILSVSLQYEIA